MGSSFREGKLGYIVLRIKCLLGYLGKEINK
jgi:hypothetical protein